MSEGAPLQDVLRELMRHAVRVADLGGRVVCHNLAFDAEIIAEELRRAGLTDQVGTWNAIAGRGLCTMSGP